MSDEIHYDREMQEREQKERDARTPHRASELAAPPLLACHWSMRDAGCITALVKTDCGETLSPQVEDFAFKFCGYCGRSISWQANDQAQRPAK